METQQAFLERHVEAFACFGGVFAQIRYDNLTSAVKKVSRAAAGRGGPVRRVALALPVCVGVRDAGPRRRPREGRRGGRSGPLPPKPPGPVPSVADLAALNAMPGRLRSRSRPARRRAGGDDHRGLADRAPAAARAGAGAVRLRRGRGAKVDQKALVTIRQTRCSVPVALGAAGLRRVGARESSISATRAPWSRATSGCTASSRPAPSSITTSSCCAASPAPWALLSRWPRNAAVARGRRFDELWAALPSATGAPTRRPDGRGRALLPRDGPEPCPAAVRAR